MLKKRALEQIVRGFSNHRRIQMLELLEIEPELSTIEIGRKLKISLKLSSAYTKRLTMAGLIMKKSQGKNIRHKLSERGGHVLNFLRGLK